VLAAVQSAVNVWTAAEGSDSSEGQLWALQQVATDPAIGWRPGAKRIVVWFGDAPGHDPVCAAISGAAADVTEATATAALQAASITVVAVSTTTSVEIFPAGLDDDPTKDAADYGVCTGPSVDRVGAGAWCARSTATELIASGVDQRALPRTAIGG